MYKCKRCGHELTSPESIKRGYGDTCYRIKKLNEAKQPVKEQPISNAILEELLDRVRKLELDNNFLKHQLKHKTFIGKSNDSELDWDIPKEVKEVKNEYKIQFNVVVKELKVIFHEGFDYHDILTPVVPVSPPAMVKLTT